MSNGKRGTLMNKQSREAAEARPAGSVSRIRLIILRAMYAFIVIGLAVFVWPHYVSQLAGAPHFQGIVLTMLAAFSILCAVGVRYPLQMLPLLFWELLWKSMWLLLIALPRWLDGSLDGPASQTAIDCLVGVVLVPLALPWGYVWAKYLKGPTDRHSMALQE